MTTITLRCSCPPQRYTTAGPQPCSPACPVHGITAREAAALRQRVETLESALRELLEVWPAVLGASPYPDGCTECHCGDATCEHDCETLRRVGRARAALSAYEADKGTR